ncbi:MAG: DUF3570 domain-containing protein [Woeseiaceae bacterium]|nr:DUF3570 domain-containing protein [Woeseiaceae bacterium]
MLRRTLGIAFAVLALGTADAGVLPDDRTDVLYHLYDGGGVEIDGPSVLVRKKVGNSVSFVGNYYVDMVSSASIDVVTTASPYTEERTQWSLGMDYLRGNTTMRIGYTNSEESDFDANTYAFSISQDLFGDLTTLTLSYALGDDLVGKADDESFERPLDRQIYGVGLTQILTKKLIASLNVETVTEEGFLNNPYRVVRYADPLKLVGYSFEPELYPNTRTSTAVGLRARYFLPYRAALEAEYRFYTDTWDVDSDTAAVSYIHPWGDWTFTGKYRWYDQTGAHFYRDLFARSEETNFRGRDKELSPLTSDTLTLQAAYEFIKDDGFEVFGFIKRAKVTASLNMLSVDYHDFSDLTAQGAIGEEPLYSLDSDVFQLYFSFFY